MKKSVIICILLTLFSFGGFAQIEDLLQGEDSVVSVMSKKEQEKYIKELEKKHEGKKEGKLAFVKKTWRKIFPEKVERNISYPLMYNEKPKSVMVMYPWNRSKDTNANQMFYVSICQELSLKGYYVLPSLLMLSEFATDTAFNSRYCKQEDSKKYLESYGVDAVLYVTIYSVKKEWWSTSVNMNAQYDMVSTKTGEVLFSRHADFNFDSQSPAKTKSKNGLIENEKVNNFIGICQQMQRYVFSDMPIGPYHKDYLMDQKKFSHKKEMKYKISVKPS